MPDTLDELRAWKDEDYRDELGFELDWHPSGLIDLSPVDSGLRADASPILTNPYCNSFSGYTSICYICTLLNCFRQLAESGL